MPVENLIDQIARKAYADLETAVRKAEADLLVVAPTFFERMTAAMAPVGFRNLGLTKKAQRDLEIKVAKLRPPGPTFGYTHEEVAAATLPDSVPEYDYPGADVVAPVFVHGGIVEPYPGHDLIAASYYGNVSISRDEFLESDKPGELGVLGEYWRAGDHVIVRPEYANSSHPRSTAPRGPEGHRAQLVGDRQERTFYFLWRLRWVDADGTLGNEATFDERDLTWVRAIPTKEPRYTQPAKRRYGVGQ